MAQRRPTPSRRSLFSRLGQRRAVLTMTAAGVVAVAGVAIAGAIGSGSNASGVRPAAAVSPSIPAPAGSPSPSQGPLGPVLTGPQPSSPAPTRAAHPRARARAARPAHLRPAAATPSAAPVKAAASTAPCAPAAQRVDEARRLLQHQDALPNVTLVTVGPRQGVLGTSDLAGRTLSLYVRGCGEESTLRLAVVWAYEAGQFVPVPTWDSATRARWQQLRGTTALGSTAQLLQDVAAVYAYWQTGTTQWWQSPVAPPSAGELSALSAFLHTS